MLFALLCLTALCVTELVGGLAASGAPGFSDGVGAAAKFNQPSGIAALRAGSDDVLYIADTGSNAVRRVTVIAGLAEESEEEAEGSPLDNSEEGAANRKLLLMNKKWQEHASLHSEVFICSQRYFCN